MGALIGFQKIAKRNRKTVLAIASFVIVTSVELTVSFVSKEARVISHLQVVSDRNNTRIDKIESDVGRQSIQLQTVVMRTSFNAYIKHTDDRFRTLNNSASGLIESIGSISGRVSGLEKIIYALNMYELRSGKLRDDGCKK